jgi:iron complex outermembrane receptor protein
MTKFYQSIRCCLLIGMAILSVSAYAQRITVSGRVTSSDDGSALPGVNILEKGTNNGTITDANGNYSISVAENATLVVSFVGYATQEIAVGAQSVINISLNADITALEEVVVIGYGSQEKREINSAVASVSAKDFNRGNVTSPTQLLTGKVAGLSVSRAGGDPNQGQTLRLRGITTFGANSEPLIVIDGIVGASLDNVDPNDIASIDVLKDGSAAAIYGTRGSSGVIMITTKSGKGGRGNYTNVEYNGFVSIDNVANKITVLSPSEFVARGGQDFGSQTNWFNELTQTGYSYTNNLTISGGTNAGTTYSASINYRNNEGIVKGVDFQRWNTRLSLGQEAMNGKLRLNFAVAYNDRKQQSINMAAFRYAVIYNPTAPIFDDSETDIDGGYFQRDLFDFFNPIALSRQQQFVGERKNALLNYSAEYDIIQDLTAKINFAQTRETGLDGAFWSIYDKAEGAGTHGSARRSTYDNTNDLLEFTLKYNRKFGTDLNSEFLLGTASQKRTFEGYAVRVKQFLYDYTSFYNLSFASNREGVNTEASGYRSEDVLLSTFGRANFNYKNTYFFSATVRAESFSGFGKNEKTGIFPAASAGVQLSELFDLGPVSNLKFRLSYGVTGALPPFSDLALPVLVPGGTVDFDGDPGTDDDQFVIANQARDPNPTLKWEEKTEINVGLDFGFFGNRLTGAIEYYTRNIDDLLFSVSIPTGAPNPFDPSQPANVAGNAWANIGQIKSAGFEFTASYNEIPIGPVKWTPSLNFTIYDKPVIESFSVGDLGFGEIRLATPGSPGQNNNEIIRNIAGRPLGDMYGPVFRGIDENGNYVLSTTNPDEFVVVGNGLPDGEFGFTNTFTFKNWDFNFLLRGVFGHDLYNSYRGFYENRDAASNTWNSVITDKTPFVTQSPTFSSLYVENASYMRLDNATIGYNLAPKNPVFSKARIYVSGQNLFTITDYTGIDPEVRYSDTENGNTFTTNLAPGLERRNTYFTTRTFTFGVTLTLK